MNHIKSRLIQKSKTNVRMINHPAKQNGYNNTSSHVLKIQSASLDEDLKDTVAESKEKIERNDTCT